MATREQPKAATEEAKIDLFEDDDEFEEFEIDQGSDTQVSPPENANPGDDSNAEEEVSAGAEVGAEADERRKRRRIAKAFDGMTFGVSKAMGMGDKLNVRNKDGTLKVLKKYTGAVINEGASLSPDLPIPEAAQTMELLEEWNALCEINRKEMYNAENIALGTMPQDYYMLIPSNWKIEVAKIEYIGGGLGEYKVDLATVAAVYALAKEQALKLQFSDEKAIKWAACRLEAFIAGWFNHQRFCLFKPAPADTFRVFLQDSDTLLTLLPKAYRLCSFIPFLAEHYFRYFGSVYSKSNSDDYIQKAKKMAAGAGLEKELDILDEETLYGYAFSWIGVYRPKQALNEVKVQSRIPAVFRIRKRSGTAGQALVTISAAVIQSLQSINWWNMLSTAGNYREADLLMVADKIMENPWKYHTLPQVYKEEGPNEEEKKALEKVRKDAQTFAPILQAYMDTVAAKSDLNKARALKYSDSNMPLYEAAKTLFNRAARRRNNYILNQFANYFFAPKEKTPMLKGREQPRLEEEGAAD